MIVQHEVMLVEVESINWLQVENFLLPMVPHVFGV
jgi:hypothetical protein